MTSINPIYNINYAQAPAFKARVESATAPVTTPIPSNNICFKGTEALAAYNYNLINKNSDFDDLRTIKPVEIPNDITKIDGNPIYNSKGELVVVEKRVGENKFIYHNNDDKLIEVFDKNGNKINEQHFNGENSLWVREFYKNKEFWSAYNIDNGELKLLSNEKLLKKDGKIIKSFLYENNLKEYQMLDYSNPNLVHTSYTNCVVYDSKKNIKEIIENTPDSRSEKIINYKNGIPYQIEEEKRTTILNNIPETLDFLNDEDLIPHPKFNILSDAINRDGHKTYYSNGKVETNSFKQDGNHVTYEFDLNGNPHTIIFDDKLIKIGKNHFCIIENNNNVEKETFYNWDDGSVHVSHLKDNKHKAISFHNGKVSSYIQSINGKGFFAEFNQDGSLKDYSELVEV